MQIKLRGRKKMKWRSRDYSEDTKPNSKRYVNKFAFLPTKCQPGYWVWLENYIETQKYIVTYIDWGVVDYRWETIERLALKRE